MKQHRRGLRHYAISNGNGTLQPLRKSKTRDKGANQVLERSNYQGAKEPDHNAVLNLEGGRTQDQEGQRESHGPKCCER